MHQNNIFSERANNLNINKRINRFNNPYFEKEKYEEFDFNNNMKSDNFKELKFTNYTTSDKCNKYHKLQEICNKIINNIEEWDKLFIADEININKDIPKLDRIYAILCKVNGRKINRKELILKFKNLEDNEIQFFVKNEKGILKLYLVDIYHLAIEAYNKKSRRIDLNGKYKAMSKASYCISNLFK